MRASPKLVVVACSFAGCALVSFVACSSKETHAPAAAGCGGAVDCNGISFPSGNGGIAVGGDASVADVGDAGIASIPVNGTVNSATSFTQDPAADPIDTGENGLTVSAYQSGTLTTASVTSGAYAFPTVDAFLWPTYFTVFELSGRNSVTGGVGVRTVLLERINAGTTSLPTLAIPSFDATLLQTIDTGFGIASATTTTTGTIVLQLLDASGTPVSGATATNPYVAPDAGTTAGGGCPNTTTTAMNCGPYYDSGDAIEPPTTTGAGSSTGPRGTIAFLAVSTGYFTTTITFSDGVSARLTVPVTNQAVTFFRGALR